MEGRLYLLKRCKHLLYYKHFQRALIKKKKWTKFRKLHFGHVMRREKLEHLVTSGMIVGKQRQKLLNGLTKWLKVGQGTEALKATRDRDAWKVMTAHSKRVLHLID